MADDNNIYILVFNSIMRCLHFKYINSSVSLSMFRQFKRVLDQKLILIFRSENKETTESETNTIDRTIANLTFNKMEINVRDFPVAIPDNFVIKSDRTTEPELKPLTDPLFHTIICCTK